MYKFKSTFERESQVLEQEIVKEVTHELTFQRGGAALLDPFTKGMNEGAQIFQKPLAISEKLEQNITQLIENFYSSIQLSGSVLLHLKKQTDHLQDAAEYCLQFEEDKSAAAQTTIKAVLQELKKDGNTADSINAVKSALVERMQALQQFLESACRQLNQYLLLWEYEKRGRMKYKFIAEGENCDTCNKLNGKVFDIKDAKVGVNLQPMHPNCDCMTGILDANGIIIALLSNKEKGKDGKNVLMELIAGKQFSFGQNPQLNLLNGNATNAGLSVLFDLPFVEWAGDRFTGVTNRENDAREHNTGDIIFGVLEAIDENNFGGAVQWVTEHFRGNATRNCESEYDYYLGRTIGNAISILVGAGTTASGVAQIIGSIVAGGAISIGSGGTLAASGVSISIAGVTAGAATVAYGGTVVTVSAAKFGDDFDKMQAAAAAENRTSGNSSADTDSDKIPQEAIEKGAGITKSAGNKVKTNLGNEINITPSPNHSTTTKNPGLKGTPNSSVDILDANGGIKTRRWFGPDGSQIRDVDFTNHGNAKVHPEWPHEHGPRN